MIFLFCDFNFEDVESILVLILILSSQASTAADSLQPAKKSAEKRSRPKVSNYIENQRVNSARILAEKCASA